MSLEINHIILPSSHAHTQIFPNPDDPSLLKMSMQGGIFLSEGKASCCPPNLARDSQNKETHHERKTNQLLGHGKCSYPGYRPIVINFERKNGEHLGIDIGSVSCQPTSLQKMKRDSVEGRFDSVLRTNHPNLLNLLGISACENDVLLHYEKPGISLTQIRQFKILDRIEVATICRKVFKILFPTWETMTNSAQILRGLIYIHEVLDIGHGNLHCDNIYLNEDGEIKIGN